MDSLTVLQTLATGASSHDPSLFPDIRRHDIQMSPSIPPGYEFTNQPSYCLAYREIDEGYYIISYEFRTTMVDEHPVYVLTRQVRDIERQTVDDHVSGAVYAHESIEGLVEACDFTDTATELFRVSPF